MSDIPPLNLQLDCDHNDTDIDTFHTPPGGSPAASMDSMIIGQELEICKRCGLPKIPKIVIDKAAQTLNREDWLEPEEEQRKEMMNKVKVEEMVESIKALKIEEKPPAAPLAPPFTKKPITQARGRALNRSATCVNLKRSEQGCGDKKTAIGSPQADGKESAPAPKRRASSVKPAARSTSKTPPAPVFELEAVPDMPFKDPSAALSQAYTDMGSTSWLQHAKALSSFMRLARHHPKLVEGELQKIAHMFAPALKNLRSQVSRAACQASVEFFKIKKFDTWCDEIVSFLMLRANDTNQFLRDDAKAALHSMVANMNHNKIISLMATKGVNHNHSNIKRTASELMLLLLKRLGQERIYELSRESRDKVFVIGAKLLQEGAAGTRANAKELMKSLMKHKDFEKIIASALPSRTLTSITKTLNVIRGEMKDM